jgi:exodeoxyribonuclease VII large subunit
VKHHFDAVAIIRGGGGDVGLACYNSYELAREIALFPIPVLTGIGHSTNETVSEMISHRNAITPTELADFLIQKFHNFSVPLQTAREAVIDRSRARLKEEKSGLFNAVHFLRKDTLHLLSHSARTVSEAVPQLGRAVQTKFTSGSDQVVAAKSDLSASTGNFIGERRLDLAVLEKNVELMDPARVLNRGYSITRVNGRVARSVSDAAEGDELTTLLADGRITSTVQSIRKTDHHER